jgi:hypothetical protein
VSDFTPKMNEDEMQCDGCGRVVGKRDNDYCTTCQPPEVIDSQARADMASHKDAVAMLTRRVSALEATGILIGSHEPIGPSGLTKLEEKLSAVRDAWRARAEAVEAGLAELRILIGGASDPQAKAMHDVVKAARGYLHSGHNNPIYYNALDRALSALDAISASVTP